MINRRTRDLRRLISYHEAGHAVAARKLGVGIASAGITLDNNHLGNVMVRSATWMAEQAGSDQAALARGLYTDLMVALAGQEAQKLAGYPEGDFRGDDNFGQGTADIDNAINLAWRLARIEAGLPMGPGPNDVLNPGDPLHIAGVAIIERVGKEIQALLKDNWLAKLERPRARGMLPRSRQ